MEDLKILQIIQAPETMRVLYKGNPDFTEKVVCIALVGDENGERYLKAVDCSADGDFSFCDEDINFKEIIFTNK